MPLGTKPLSELRTRHKPGVIAAPLGTKSCLPGLAMAPKKRTASASAPKKPAKRGKDAGAIPADALRMEHMVMLDEWMFLRSKTGHSECLVQICETHINSRFFGLRAVCYMLPLQEHKHLEGKQDNGCFSERETL